MDILDVWREICKVIRSAAAQMYKTVYTGYHTTYNLYKTDAWKLLPAGEFQFSRIKYSIDSSCMTIQYS